MNHTSPFSWFAPVGSGAVTLVLVLLAASCAPEKKVPASLSTADSLAIVQDNVAHRADVDEFFRIDPDSPFQRDSSISYHGVHWFPIDPHYRVQSVLHRYEHADTVVVLGTKGEPRRQLRYGYFAFTLPDEHGIERQLTLNVYKFTPYDRQRYALYRNNLSLWFTDSTTGDETYEVGRYLEMGVENPDPSFVYTIDFNKAFNPYCAYSSLYSCAIPTKDDHLDLALRAGEQRYH
jgi:uncharacterized protein